MELTTLAHEEVKFRNFLRHSANVSHAVLRSNVLTLQEKGLYSILCSYGWSGSAFPGQKRLAEENGVSERTIRRIIKRLVELKLISVEDRRKENKTNIYYIEFPDDEVMKKLFPGGYDNPPPDTSVLRGGDHRTSVSSAHRTPVSYKDLTEEDLTDKEPTSQDKTGKKNLSNDAEVESFVESQMASNPFDRIPKKLIIKYINAIRFRRKTNKIAESIVAGLWKEWKNFDQDVVAFALWTHIEKYSKDKDENYTLGIMRNTDIHEARRQLMVLKNKNQSPQQTKPMSYWEQKQRQEEELERKRISQRDRQIKVQQFIDAGFNPMFDGELLEEWLQGNVTLDDLKKKKCGS
jgi:Helix-turn-helix domain